LFVEKNQISKYKMMFKSKYCTFPNCIADASYGNCTEKNKYCYFHKNNNMIYTRRLCYHKNCSSLGIYGSKKSRRKWCLKHSNTKTYIEKPNFCLKKKCKRTALYKYPDETELSYCREHSLYGMKIINFDTEEYIPEKI